jgi:hypothetical protein
MGLGNGCLNIQPAFATRGTWLTVSLVDDEHALTLIGASL